MSKLNEGMFSSSGKEYETPQWLFDHFNSIFNFELDVCASDENAKCEKYYTSENDGLKQPWMRCNWMNPPYGNKIPEWVQKAYEEGLKGRVTVCLLPARTDTRWWQDYVMKADLIHFIRGRLKFNQQKSSAPFPSAIAIFGLFKYEI